MAIFWIIIQKSGHVAARPSGIWNTLPILCSLAAEESEEESEEEASLALILLNINDDQLVLFRNSTTGKENKKFEVMLFVMFVVKRTFVFCQKNFATKLCPIENVHEHVKELSITKCRVANG